MQNIDPRKQVQEPPKGLREVEFYEQVTMMIMMMMMMISSSYEQITRSEDPERRQWRALAPSFHGVETVLKESGDWAPHLVLGQYSPFRSNVIMLFPQRT